MKAIKFKVRGDFFGTLVLREDIGDPSKRAIVKYHVTTPTGIVFQGDGYIPALGTQWDSPESVYGLLFFLTQTPDSGASFEDYTPEQLEWSKSSECEIWSYMFSSDDASIKYWRSEDGWSIYLTENQYMYIWIKELDNVG